MHELLLSLALLTGGAPTQAGAEPMDRVAEQVEASLSSAATGGTWEAGGKKGQYRVVVFSSGLEHVSSQVYLQWLEEGRASRVVRSIRVGELSSGSWSVGEPVFSQAAGGGTIELEATNPYTLESSRFALKPGEVGAYSIQEQKAGGR